MLLRAHADLAMDVVNLKISKLGGLTKTKQARDLCVSHGDRDDAGRQLGRRHHHGRDRSPGAQHARGVPLHRTDFNSYVTVSTADGAPRREHGFMGASEARASASSPGPRCSDLS